MSATEIRASELGEYLKKHAPAEMLHVHSEKQTDSSVRFTVWLSGRVVGEMTITVEPLVHGMTIEEGMLQRKIADALFQYASGYVRASGFSEALVLVADTNAKMQHYVESRSIPEESGRIYLLEVR